MEMLLLFKVRLFLEKNKSLINLSLLQCNLINLRHLSKISRNLMNLIKLEYMVQTCMMLK